MTFATAGFGCGAFHLFAGVEGRQVPRQLYRKNLIQAWYFIPFFFLPSFTLVQYLWTGKLFLRLQIRIHQMSECYNRMMTLLFSDILSHTHCNFIVSVQYFLSLTPLRRGEQQPVRHAARRRRGQTPLVAVLRVGVCAGSGEMWQRLTDFVSVFSLCVFTLCFQAAVTHSVCHWSCCTK